VLILEKIFLRKTQLNFGLEVNGGGDRTISGKIGREWVIMLKRRRRNRELQRVKICPTLQL